MKVIARDDADATKFYMSKPCKWGHSGKRYVCNRQCVECSTIRNATPKMLAARTARASTPKGKILTQMHRLRRHGMLLCEYYFMLAGQQYRCVICGTDEPGGRGRWHVDHDHVTGAVRGLLCHCCNTGLGQFKDSPANLIAAIEYLNAA